MSDVYDRQVRDLITDGIRHNAESVIAGQITYSEALQGIMVSYMARTGATEEQAQKLEEEMHRRMENAIRDVAQERNLKEHVAQPRTDLVQDANRLSLDAQVVEHAIKGVVQDRMAEAPAAERQVVVDHAHAKLADREALDGPITIPPEAKRMVMGMEDFRNLVGEVNKRSANVDAVALREDVEKRIGTVTTVEGLVRLLDMPENKRDLETLAKHLDQGQIISDRIDRLADELRIREATINIRQGPAPPFVEDGMSADISVHRLSRAKPDASYELPDQITQNYDIHKRGDASFYYQKDDGQLAIRATDNRIQGMNREPRTIEAVIDLAMAQGWTNIAIRGDRDVTRQAWIEATARGLQAEGYAPTRDDRQEVEQRRLAREERGMPDIDPPSVRTMETRPRL